MAYAAAFLPPAVSGAHDTETSTKLPSLRRRCVSSVMHSPFSVHSAIRHALEQLLEIVRAGFGAFCLVPGKCGSGRQEYGRSSALQCLFQEFGAENFPRLSRLGDTITHFRDPPSRISSPKIMLNGNPTRRKLPR